MSDGIAAPDPLPADIPPTTFFVSERLWYRAPEPHDASQIAAWRNDPRIRRTTPPRFPCTPGTAEKWIATRNPWERGVANDHALFMFGPHGKGSAIGYMGLFAIDWLNQQADFGIAIDPAHWAQGYGREVTARLLEYAFLELNLHRIELTVLSSNPAGIRAYRSAGFVVEGTKRQADFVQGAWEDVLLMAVLREEWKRG